MEHNVKTFDKGDQVVLKCSCGWESSATDSVFAKAIKERHETLTKVTNGN